jgi:hypothetical protein
MFDKWKKHLQEKIPDLFIGGNTENRPSRYLNVAQSLKHGTTVCQALTRVQTSLKKKTLIIDQSSFEAHDWGKRHI